MSGWNFAHVQGDVNPHSLRMREVPFSLVAAQLLTKACLIYSLADDWLSRRRKFIMPL